MKCEDCKHWFDNGTNLSSCDRDALLRERDFFCAAWERKKPFERLETNADLVRQMKVEELAIFCEDGCPPGAPICNSVETIEGEAAKEHCQRCWLNWLKAPVEEVDK